MKQALQNLGFMSVPSVLYAVVAWRRGLSCLEVRRRLGLRLGPGRSYVVGAIGAVIAAPIGIAASRWTGAFPGSMIAPFVQAKPTVSVLWAICTYGVLATGAPEELMFRGLIAGVLFRRLSFWKANLLQASVFLAPHLLLLAIAPKLWLPVAFVFPLGLCLGWLRHASGSIGPGILVHSASNVAGALAVLDWGLHR